jgi:hypothetical protein
VRTLGAAIGAAPHASRCRTPIRPSEQGAERVRFDRHRQWDVQPRGLPDCTASQRYAPRACDEDHKCAWRGSTALRPPEALPTRHHGKRNQLEPPLLLQRDVSTMPGLARMSRSTAVVVATPKQTNKGLVHRMNDTHVGAGDPTGHMRRPAGAQALVE